MPRSGTTWLMEMIATQPGFKVINEPFNLRKEVVREHLRLDRWESLFEEESLPKIADYVQQFMDGRDTDLRFFRYAPFSEFWKLRTHRVLFKILFVGEGYFDWFSEMFNGEVIYLLRHPIPVSQSRESLPRLASFRHSPYSRHFSAQQLAIADQVIARGDAYEQAVLDWCFQNAVPLRQMKPEWLTLSYEQMVLEPEKVIGEMVRRYGFEQPEQMYSRVHKASNSTAKSNGESQAVLMDPQKIQENRRWLVEKWAKKATQDQIDKTFYLLDVFGIDFYEKGSFLPKAQYLI
jgi:hypothetical protein